MKNLALLFIWLPVCILVMIPQANAQNADEILLKDFRPKSIYKIPRTEVQRAKFPVIDVHSHTYAGSLEEVEVWVDRMDMINIDRTVILTNAVYDRLDSLMQVYGAFPDHFEVWCGLDVTDYQDPGYADRAIEELERCHEMGGMGIGELSDKGWGVRSGGASSDLPHFDDPALKPVFQRAGELGMPVNIHVADPIWMYEPMDSTNDGLMTAWRWRLDNREDIKSHAEMMQVLENAVRDNSNTTFIVVHYANLTYDLEQLGRMLDNYPNLYADISARYSEISNIPRFVKAFFEQYQDRLLYGTDLGYSLGMYQTTFRILETEDEHFYNHNVFPRHWGLNGLGLSDEVLEKVYGKNANNLFERLRSN
ncbi:MAG: amidohydrolase family protein [Balneolales bacterium]